MSKITFIFIISNGNQPPVYSTLNVPCQVIKSLGPQGTFRKLLIIIHEQQKHRHEQTDFNHRLVLTHLWARFLFRVSSLRPSQEDFATVTPTKQASDIYLTKPVCSIQMSFTFYWNENVNLFASSSSRILISILATYILIWKGAN